MDKAEGIKLQEKAAAQSGEVQTIAQYNLCIAYSSGEGVSVGNFESSKWLKSSAEQGHALSHDLPYVVTIFPRNSLLCLSVLF